MHGDAIDRRTVAGLAITGVAAVLAVAAAPNLPEQLTTHWDATGTPDGTMPKLWVLVGGPALVLATVGLFEVFPRIDPLGENVEQFQAAYDATAVLVAGFLAYAFGVVLAWNLGVEFAITQALAPAIAALYVAIGFVFERAERNWFVGVRNPWTLSSAQVWRDTHDLAATLFKVAGAIALGGAVLPAYFVYFVAVPAAGTALLATAYSYYDYRRVGDGDPAEATDGV